MNLNEKRRKKQTKTIVLYALLGSWAAGLSTGIAAYINFGALTVPDFMALGVFSAICAGALGELYRYVSLDGTIQQHNIVSAGIGGVLFIIQVAIVSMFNV